VVRRAVALTSGAAPAPDATLVSRAAAARGRGRGLPLRARMAMVRCGDHLFVDALFPPSDVSL